MAYIAPNSDVYLLQNVPLSKDYENTILFSNATAQANYFISKCPGVSFSFTDTTFVRQLPGSISLEIPAESAMLCNYLMYRNTSFGNKWFYAFIDSVEYVSNSTSRINFTLDVIQTWHFEYNLTDCFLERNHTKTDEIGDSLTGEPVSFGDLVDNEIQKLLSDNFYAVVATVDIDQNLATPIPAAIPIIGTLNLTSATQGKVYQHIYSGLTLTIFNLNPTQSDPTGTADIDAFLAYYIDNGKQDAINAIFMVPGETLGLDNQGDPVIPADGGTQLGSVINAIETEEYKELPQIDSNSTLDGYAPKNKKLFTYPYNKLAIGNGSGSELQLRYEYFNDPEDVCGRITFNIQQPVSARFSPKNYAGIGPIATVDVVNNEYQIILGNYPMCSWNVDSYAAWQAQNSINLGSNLIGLGYNAAKGYFGGSFTGQGGLNLISSAMGGISSLVSMLMQDYAASRAADTLHGSANSGNGAIAQFRQNFFASRKSVNHEDAKIIDDYMTMFGYTINSICHITSGEDPRDHRPHFTFIKTVGCDIEGTLPAEDARQINSIYDKGIRWWKVPSEVGDYSVDNSPST